MAKKERQYANYEIGKRLSIRLTEEEKKLIISYAKADGLTVSDYIKNVALKKIYVANRIEYQADLRNLNFEISKIGVNINQLAKHVNRTDKFKTIDAGTINIFHLFMKDYLHLMDDATELLKQMYRRLSKVQ